MWRHSSKKATAAGAAGFLADRQQWNNSERVLNATRIRAYERRAEKEIKSEIESEREREREGVHTIALLLLI